MIVSSFAISPADTAHAAAQVYTWSLLATVPLLLAWIAAAMLSNAPASTRKLVWRSAIVGLLTVFVAQLLPYRWSAGVVPIGLAQPLVALGRVEVGAGGAGGSSPLLLLMLGVYVIGSIVAIAPVVRGLAGWRRVDASDDAERCWGWNSLLKEARESLGVSRPVAIRVVGERIVPVTYGVLRPIIVVPSEALEWPIEQQRALVLHEVAHVAAFDVAFNLLARVARALFWFHPLAWLAARELQVTSELACDDRVLATGVKQSDYADLLLRASDTLLPGEPAASMAIARGTLRDRLAAIVTPGRDLRAAGRTRVVIATIATLIISIPVGALRPEPTREVLTALMHDTRWDARAYAVIGLAQRADSLAIAQAAARHDPSARVRELATVAIAQHAPAALLKD